MPGGGMVTIIDMPAEAADYLVGLHDARQQADPVREALVAALKMQLGEKGHAQDCIGAPHYGGVDCSQRCRQARAALALAEEVER